MQWSPIELVGDDQRGPVGYQGEDGLVLGSGGSVVEGGTTQLVSGIDRAVFSYHHVHTFDVTVCMYVCVFIYM